MAFQNFFIHLFHLRGLTDWWVAARAAFPKTAHTAMWVPNVSDIAPEPDADMR